MVLTDYPDTSLVQNLELNVKRNVLNEIRERVHVKVPHCSSTYFKLATDVPVRDTFGANPSNLY